MTSTELVATLEALLFVATEPIKIAQLADITEAPEEDVAAALDKLKVQLNNGGLQLNVTGGAYQLATAANLTPIIERFLGNQVRAELSRPALETLAVVVYRQPITKLQIDNIRGISSDQTLKNLLLRDLITEAGHAQEAGKPTLYRPSHRLLQHLGISSFDELISLEELPRENNAT